MSFCSSNHDVIFIVRTSFDERDNANEPRRTHHINFKEQQMSELKTGSFFILYATSQLRNVGLPLKERSVCCRVNEVDENSGRLVRDR